MADWVITGASTGEMTVSMDGQQWKDALKKAKERLEMRSAQVGMEGERIDKSDIAKVAINENIQYMFETGLGELNLKPVSEPVINMKKMNSEGVTIGFTFAVMPEIRIPDLSALSYQVPAVNVSNEEIQAEIQALKESVAAQGMNIPTDDDEFAQMLGIEGVDCMEALRASINDALVTNRKAVAEAEAENALLDAMAELFEFDAPDGMVEMEIDSMIAGDKDKVASMNGQWEDFLKSARKTEEDLRDDYLKEAKRNIKVRLALAEIAKEFNLKPSAEDIEAEYAAMAQAYGVPVEDFKSAIAEDDMVYQKSLVMAMDYLKK